MSIFWWMSKPSHFRFILRELTSLPVALFSLELIFFLRSVARGSEAYNDFLETLSSPWMILLNLLAFGGLIYHSITWFNLSASAMVVKIGKIRLPGRFIILMNYLGWLIVTFGMVWLLTQ
jgi:fumarate reductase subunit C